MRSPPPCPCELMDSNATGQPRTEAKTSRARWQHAVANPPLRWIILLLGGTVCLVVQLRFIWASEMAYLATSWLPDDAYYYLQPAWLTRTHAPFTFDGENTTYGFQPLWMLVLSVLAQVTGDKDALLRGALSANAVLHVLNGALLWAWLRRGGHPWRGLIAAMLWWCNPSLFHMYGSGMESSLYAFLLLALLCFPTRGDDSIWGVPDRPTSQIAFGVLCGLLILCRVNALLLVAALLLRMAFHRDSGARDRLRRVALVVSSAGLVVAPWIVFAAGQLGAVFPTSGERKK